MKYQLTKKYTYINMMEPESYNNYKFSELVVNILFS